MDFSQIAEELSKLTPQVLLQIFIIAQALDITSGYLAARQSNTFVSKVAINGIMRQGMRLAFFVSSMYVQHIVRDTSTPLELLITGYQVAMIIAYIKSLFENYDKFKGVK